MTTQTFQLVMRAGPSPGKIFTLSANDIIIGRDVGADVVINAAEISRRHTRLRLEAGGYVIEDLGSTNGTFVNGQRLTAPQVLRSGDIIMLGEAATLAYESSQYDPNATMISPSTDRSSMGTPAPAPVQQPPVQQQPVVQPLPQPPPAQPPQAYAGQVPAGPAPSPAPPIEPPPSQPKRGGLAWIWAGAGCLVVMLCVFVVGALLFDMLNLYCTPPFDAVFGFMYTCP